jgi:hypothetical protein
MCINAKHYYICTHMKQLFLLVIVCVSVHALSFTYVKGMKLIAVETESMELEDCSAENESSEEAKEELNGHCPFWEPVISGRLFLASLPVSSQKSHMPTLEHITGVECPPPKA